MKSALIAMAAMFVAGTGYSLAVRIIFGEPGDGATAMIMCGVGYLAWRIEEMGR